MIFATLNCEAQSRWSIKRSKRFGTLLPKAYVMIITGQSNALSAGQNLNNSFTANPQLTKHFDSTTNAFIPYVSNLFNGGYETQAGGLQGALRGDTILLIRVAYSGVSITNWSKDGNGYIWTALKRNIDSAFNVIRRSSKRPIVLSVMWDQGSTDALNQMPQAEYTARIDTVIQNIQSLQPELLSSNFVMVKIRPDNTFGAGGTNSPVANVNLSMDAMVTKYSFCRTIDPVAIGAGYADCCHFGSGSFMILANYWSSIIP